MRITLVLRSDVYIRFIMETALIQSLPANERRRHLRSKGLGLVVHFGGKTHTTQDWSMGGFLLKDYEGALSTGALMTVAGLGWSARKLQTVNVAARVVRTGKHTIAVTYLSLDYQAYEFLEQSMCDNGDMRNLLDF